MRLFKTTFPSGAELADQIKDLPLPDGFKFDRVRAALGSATGVKLVPNLHFILDEDGNYQTDVNEFLRSLPLGYTPDGISTGRPSKSRNSWRATSNDIATFAAWLEDERGRHIWDAEPKDVHAFHEMRRVIKDPTTGAVAVGAGTWNRNHSSLNRLFNYGMACGYTDRNPFSGAGGGFARERSVRRQRIRFVSLEAFDAWCEVGLRGEGAERGDGSRVLRQGTRNVTFAQFLVRTGARLTEAASLLVMEIPAISRRGERSEIELGGASTKGGVERSLRVAHSGLQPIHEWQSTERAILVANARESGRYNSEAFNRARLLPSGRLRFQEGAVKAHGLLDPDARRLLLVHRAEADWEPAALWLSEDGVPMSAASWHSVFRRANERCVAAGLPIRITPHMLRHTFAVHMLSLLMAESLKPIRQLLATGADDQSVSLRRLLLDPIRMLQVMLGHSHYSTTLNHYLPYVQQATEVSDAALERWQGIVGPRLDLLEDLREVEGVS